MHGLVFKTSIWLLAGSTRLLSFLFFSYLLLKSVRLKRSVKFLKGSIVVNESNSSLESYRSKLERIQSCFCSFPLLLEHQLGAIYLKQKLRFRMLSFVLNILTFIAWFIRFKFSSEIRRTTWPNYYMLKRYINIQYFQKILIQYTRGLT